VRVKPEIHRKLAYLAQQENTSLNHLVEESLIKYTEAK
jgi:predicted HicB family RNase H-like nuclease